MSEAEKHLTEVMVDRDCVITHKGRKYQLFAGQSFTVMLGKLCLTGPANRDSAPMPDKDVRCEDVSILPVGTCLRCGNRCFGSLCVECLR